MNLFSSTKNPYEDFYEPNKYLTNDYIDHLLSLGESYVRNETNNIISITPDVKKYLEEVYTIIVKSNELFLKEYNIKPSFYFLKSNIPFCFSLPRAHFYFSSGFVKKYLKSEDLLRATLTFEIMKSLNNVYEKRITVPTGNVTTEKILAITRINEEIQLELNRWTYLALKRSGFDPASYLSWLQAKNKNSADFIFMYSDIRHLPDEEYEYKKFMVEEEKKTIVKIEMNKNSSKSYYKFIDIINSRS